MCHRGRRLSGGEVPELAGVCGDGAEISVGKDWYHEDFYGEEEEVHWMGIEVFAD